MKLTPKEKKICKEYSKRKYGKQIIRNVRCAECPLVISNYYRLCLKNASTEDIEEFEDEVKAVKDKLEELLDG